jgi:hypothetical protein
MRPIPKTATGTLSQVRSRERISLASFALVAVVSTAIALALASPFNHAIVVSIVRDTAKSNGLDPDDFARMAQIESSFDPQAYHPVSKASGLFQFIPATAQEYNLTAVFNPRANAEAAAALWLNNRRVLRRRLGREPTSGELYLAHQQGAGGAIDLLTHPDELAIELLGYDAVTMNGGTDDMTAQAFAAKWVSRFQRD